MFDPDALAAAIGVDDPQLRQFIQMWQDMSPRNAALQQRALTAATEVYRDNSRDIEGTKGQLEKFAVKHLPAFMLAWQTISRNYLPNLYSVVAFHLVLSGTPSWHRLLLPRLRGGRKHSR